MTKRRAQAVPVADGVIAVDTEFSRPQHDASHLIVENGRAAFVDTGSNDSVPLLLDSLQQQDLDVGDVDYVFLTHIHLDHAGGAGTLMQALPNAMCVVHPRGAAHMVDPARIVAGTNAVYGAENARRMYGDIVPIDADRILQPADVERYSLAGRELEAFYTEGHALHHYSLFDSGSGGVFSGDSFGVSYREFDTAAGPFIFPSTTPTHFDPDAAHAAYERILGYQPECVFLTHYSRVDNLEQCASDLHACVDAYVAIAKKHRDDAQRGNTIEAAMGELLATRARAHGFGGSDETMRGLLAIDTVLNAQGLVAWLERLERQGTA